MSLFDQEDPTVAAPAPITAAQMPTFAPPAPAPAAPRGLLSRVGDFAREAGSRAKDNLFQAPTALAGLVDQNDVGNARRQGLLQLGIALSQGHGENPLQSLGRGLSAAQEAFQGSLQGVIDQKKQAQSAQVQQLQQQRIQAQAALARQFAPQPNETQEQSIARLSKYAAAMTSVDPEAAAKLSETIKALREPTGALHTIDAGAKKITVDGKGAVVREDTVTESPAVAARNNAIASASARAADAATRAQDRAAAAETTATRRQENVIVHDVENNKVAKDFHGAEAAYAVLKAARDGTGKNFMRPMASLDALARMLNPQGAVRQGTLQILKDQGSLGQKLQRSWSMIQKGEWPAGMQQEVYAMADAIMQEHAADYEQFREEALSRAEAQGLDRSKIDKFLHKAAPRSAVTPSKAGKLGGY